MANRTGTSSVGMRTRKPHPFLRHGSASGRKGGVDSNLPVSLLAKAPIKSSSEYLQSVLTNIATDGQVIPGPRRVKSATNMTIHQERSLEDYREELLSLKRNLKVLNDENSFLKSKLSASQKDIAKREKQLAEMLDPTKSKTDVVAADSKAPTGQLAINSLKQKIIKLESAVKEKDNQLHDIRTTSIEECKIQVEVMYKEIVRLQTLLAGKDKSIKAGLLTNGTKEEVAARMKSLQETVLKLNENNEKLKGQIRALKSTGKVVQHIESDDDDAKDDLNEAYRDMSRSKLLGVIDSLEKRLATQRKKSDGTPMENGCPNDEKFKLLLEKKDVEIAQLRKTIKQLEQKIRNIEKGGKDKSVPTKTFGIESEEDEFASQKPSKSTTKKVSLTPSQSRRLKFIRENQASRTIQRGWRSYSERKERKEHRNPYRSGSLRNQHSHSDSDEVGSERDDRKSRDSGIDDAASVLRAAAMAHRNRNSYSDGAESVRSGRSMRSNKSASRHSVAKEKTTRKDTEDRDSDEFFTSK